MQEVSRQSEGRYKLGPGTLYDNLQRLMEREFVEEAAHRAAGDDPRRRYYRLSALGVVREAKARLHGAKTRRA